MPLLMSAADPLADEELVRAAQSGDPQARETLVDRFYAPVHALTRRLLGDRWEARDAAQETFLRAFAALDGFDATRPFAPWLFSIAANFVRDRFRRRRPAAALESADEAALATELPESAPGRTADDLACVLAAVDRLPFDLKIVVVLHFQQGCSHSEVAQALGVTVNTVRIRLYRGLALLRRRFGKEPS